MVVACVKVWVHYDYGDMLCDVGGNNVVIDVEVCGNVIWFMFMVILSIYV